MHVSDVGVLENSFMDFTIPSEFARKALYYIPQYGHFFCDATFQAERSKRDWAFMALVRSGSLIIQIKQEQITAKSGNLVLLDCKQPFYYSCTDNTEFLWIHFCGKCVSEYCEFLIEQHGIVYELDHILQTMFRKVFSTVQILPLNEHILSMDIHRLLSNLATPNQQKTIYPSLVPAIEYIRKNFAEQVSILDLAGCCNMSQSHFIRSFQKCFAHTPHDYLLAYRLRQAKVLLTMGGESVEQIAEMCGFNSASHFARAFRKHNGISPSEFRRISL